jgi:hypothetical protein
MSKKKSVFVTAVMAIMLAAIMFATYRLSLPVFIVLISTMSVAGFVSFSILFCKWLQKPSEREDNNLDVISFNHIPHYGEEHGAGYEMTYEQIKQELNGGGK